MTSADEEWDEFGDLDELEDWELEGFEGVDTTEEKSLDEGKLDKGKGVEKTEQEETGKDERKESGLIESNSTSKPAEENEADAKDAPITNDATTSPHATLKYSLLGPSLLKAGQEQVDQSKVSDIIYNASKGSKYFDREEEKDKLLSAKIAEIVAHKERLSGGAGGGQDLLSSERRQMDALLGQLEAERDLSQIIVHVDCDAFYAAVEVLERPELADVPFAVGGGVLSTCNYAARAFGCRSGMAGFVARKLCPQLELLRPDFAKYTAKAQEVRAVLAQYDARFESVSIDEAYLNLTGYVAEHHGQLSAWDAVQKLRRHVFEASKITVSAGIAANTRLAKICSNIQKPDGQYELPRDREAILQFMKDLPCRRVNGVGRVFERQLQAVGVRTCGDVFSERAFLPRLFGHKAAHFLLQCYLGVGRTRVHPAAEYERKSVGTETTFSSSSSSSSNGTVGIAHPDLLRTKLRETAVALEKDLARAACTGHTLVLKIKLDTFQVYTRQVVVPKPLAVADDLYKYALPMLSRLEQELPNMKVRLMGLRCTRLASTKKPDTMAFFGLAGNAQMKKVATTAKAPDEEEWEVWPEAMEGGEGQEEGQTRTEPLDAPHHGRLVTANPIPPSQQPQPPPEPLWTCPVCLRPQPADERIFNQHVDSCLSRRAILEAVQQDAPPLAPPSSRSSTRSPEKRPREKKRGRPRATSDARQKKICFGA